MYFDILCTDFVKIKVYGIKQKIQLINGETIEVAISNDGYKDDIFVVTDIKSGLAIASDYLEETAILSAQEKLNWVVDKFGSVDTFRKKRLKELEND